MTTSQSHPHRHTPFGGLRDVVGWFLSTLCIIHCLATPFVVAAIPAIGSFLGGFHPVILFFVIAVALWSFVPGVRRHGKLDVVAAAVAGTTALAVAALFLEDVPWADIALSLVGAGLMMFAHWRNRVHTRAVCERCAH